MQDLIGVRIVLYFQEDVDICVNILNDIFEMVDCERDTLDTETFKPVRINYVYKIPKELNDIKYEYIVDNTFEIQIRTVLSEGWHEVEHDIKYKNKKDWETETEMARDFNAVLAVLEMCDNNILGICDNLAYNKYKIKDIEPMIRCRFRLKFEEADISNKLLEVIKNIYDSIAKGIFRFSKERLVQLFIKTGIEVTIQNTILLINIDKIHDEEIMSLADSNLVKTYNANVKEINDNNESEYTYKSIVAMRYE